MSSPSPSPPESGPVAGSQFKTYADRTVLPLLRGVWVQVMIVAALPTEMPVTADGKVTLFAKREAMRSLREAEREITNIAAAVIKAKDAIEACFDRVSNLKVAEGSPVTDDVAENLLGVTGTTCMTCQRPGGVESMTRDAEGYWHHRSCKPPHGPAPDAVPVARLGQGAYARDITSEDILGKTVDVQA